MSSVRIRRCRLVASLAWALVAACSGAPRHPVDTAPLALEALEIHVDEGAGPLVVFLHGYGSAPETFLGLAERTDLPAGTGFVLPRAPLPIPDHDAGTMWWPLPAHFADIGRGPMPGAADARASVARLLDRAQGSYRDRPLVLGGFSQGAMVALDLALHDPRPIAGLVLMSGTMIDEPDTLARLDARRGLRVYASHGRLDSVLAYGGDLRLVDAMRDHGLDVHFTSFEGDHEVTPEVSTEVAAFIRDSVPRQRPPG